MAGGISQLGFRTVEWSSQGLSQIIWALFARNRKVRLSLLGLTDLVSPDSVPRESQRICTTRPACQLVNSPSTRVMGPLSMELNAGGVAEISSGNLTTSLLCLSRVASRLFYKNAIFLRVLSYLTLHGLGRVCSWRTLQGLGLKSGDVGFGVRGSGFGFRV